MVQVRERMNEVMSQYGGGWPPSQEMGLLRDRIEPAASLYSLQHLSQWPEASELFHSEDSFSLYERLLTVNFFLCLFCLGLKRQSSSFWDIQSDSHQTVASSKNHKNLSQGLDILYGTGKRDEVFSSSIPCPSEMTTHSPSRSLLFTAKEDIKSIVALS